MSLSFRSVLCQFLYGSLLISASLKLKADDSTGVWTVTPALNLSRSLTTASTLSNGTVLVTGGQHLFSLTDVTNTAEIYDPVANTWTYTGNMNSPRTQHTATVLSNGLVLIAGGTADAVNSDPLTSAELYNPAAGTFKLTGSMTYPRYGHDAVLLKNGMVLVAGGTVSQGYSTNTAELYNPATGTWSVTGSMSQSLIYFGMVPLANGNALAAGSGGDAQDAEVYSIASGSWSFTGNLSYALSGNTLVLLKNGLALAAPAYSGLNSYATQIYNPKTNTWIETYGTSSRVYAQTITLQDGNVLTMGGCERSCSEQDVASTSLFQPSTGKWENATSMTYGRMFFSVTLLQDGRVLVVGSDNGSGAYLPEIYQP